MNNFENKTVYFVGDSNITQPFFLEYLRENLLHTKKRTYLYNKGVPGARMDMVKNYIDEEISVLKPDYVVLSFGGNDLGIWLYDAYNAVTDEVLSEREKRIQKYCNALECLIVDLKSKYVVPILMTPLCYNEDIVERQDVKTERDNKEKCAIKNTLFTKASFKNINIGQKIICEKGKSIADKYRVQVWDAYSFTKEKVDGSCFYGDGVHYNEKGHRIIAELIYENMFGEKLLDYTIEKCVRNISDIEADERAYYFVKYNLIFFAYGTKQGKDLADALNGFIKEKGYVEGLTKERAEGFFRFAQDTVLNTRRIIGKVTDMFTR